MVSRKIIQNHNGKFEIQSIPEKGTTVTISLPIELNHLDLLKMNDKESTLYESS